MLKRFFWGVCYFSGPDQDRPGEGQCGSSVAGSIWYEATATLPGIRQFLLQIHQELQSDNSTITHSHLSTFQVLVACWGSFSIPPHQVLLSTNLADPWPLPKVYCGGRCVGGWSWCSPFAEKSWGQQVHPCAFFEKKFPRWKKLWWKELNSILWFGWTIRGGMVA